MIKCFSLSLFSTITAYINTISSSLTSEIIQAAVIWQASDISSKCWLVCKILYYIEINIIE